MVGKFTPTKTKGYNRGSAVTDLSVIAAPGANKKIVVMGGQINSRNLNQLESNGSTSVFPNIVGASGSATVPFIAPVDGIPLFECLPNESLTVTITTSGEGYGLLQYFECPTNIVVETMGKTLLTADINTTTAQTNQTKIAAPGVGKKIVIWKILGTFTGRLVLMSAATTLYEATVGTSLSTASQLCIPYCGTPVLMCAENEALNFTTSQSSGSPATGVRFWYTIENSDFNT